MILDWLCPDETAYWNSVMNFFHGKLNYSWKIRKALKIAEIINYD